MSAKDSKPAELHFKNLNDRSMLRLMTNFAFLHRDLSVWDTTRGGCGTLCGNGNMPCTGCFGPYIKSEKATAQKFFLHCHQVLRLTMKMKLKLRWILLLTLSERSIALRTCIRYCEEK